MEIMRREIENDTPRRNEYIKKENIPLGWTLFKFRSDMYDAKKNFKNNPIYKKESFLCDGCKVEVDENVHVLYCVSYRDLRTNKDLSSDRDLAVFLQQVLNIRAKHRDAR